MVGKGLTLGLLCYGYVWVNRVNRCVVVCTQTTDDALPAVTLPTCLEAIAEHVMSDHLAPEVLGVSA